MKLIEFIKKYQLVLFLSFLVIVLIIIKLIYGSDNKKQAEIVIPTITPIPTVLLVEPTISIKEFQTEISQEINYDYPLAQILPYSTENFIIERYTKPLVIEVEALNQDKVLVEKEVMEWINKNGSTAESHKIVWK